MPARLLGMAVVPSRSDLVHRKDWRLPVACRRLGQCKLLRRRGVRRFLPRLVWLARVLPVAWSPCRLSICLLLVEQLALPSSSLVVVSLCLDMEPSCAELLICMLKKKMACDALQGQSYDYEMQMPPV